MARASVHLPSLLLICTAGENDVPVEGNTLSGALEDLFEQFPLLKTHVYESEGTQRQHVNIFLDGENVRWFDSLDRPVKEGAEIMIIQAVSGG